MQQTVASRLTHLGIVSFFKLLTTVLVKLIGLRLQNCQNIFFFSHHVQSKSLQALVLRNVILVRVYDFLEGGVNDRVLRQADHWNVTCHNGQLVAHSWRHEVFWCYPFIHPSNSTRHIGSALRALCLSICMCGKPEAGRALFYCFCAFMERVRQGAEQQIAFWIKNRVGINANKSDNEVKHNIKRRSWVIKWNVEEQGGQRSLNSEICELDVWRRNSWAISSDKLRELRLWAELYFLGLCKLKNG